MRDLSWPDLQLYRHREAFRSSWSNVIDRQTCHESLQSLIEALEDRIRVEALPFTYVMKLLVRNEHHYYENSMTYHLIDGQWQFKRGHLRHTKAFADITNEQDVSLRVRVRAKPSSTANSRLVAVAKKYVVFNTPPSDVSPDACAFGSTVSLSPDTPVDLIIRFSFVIAKTHVAYEGLRFSFGYADLGRTKVRLACHSIVCDPTTSCDTEAITLVERMLNLLQQPRMKQLEVSQDDFELDVGNEPKDDWEEWA